MKVNLFIFNFNFKIMFNKNDYKLFFIGTKPKIIDISIKKIKSKYKNLKIIGYRDGYIDIAERKKILVNIKNLNPDIVICGMGTPLQEQFLLDLKSIGWDGIGFTCGGFLHQTAKKLEYYPKYIDKYNLRWLYRIFDEPKLIKRYTVDYIKFVFIFVYDFIISDYGIFEDKILSFIMSI